jgi:hypothetical protein
MSEAAGRRAPSTVPIGIRSDGLRQIYPNCAEPELHECGLGLEFLTSSLTYFDRTIGRWDW